MAAPEQQNGLKFLVVDDQFNVRRMVQNFLRTFGHPKAREASDGAKALDLLKIHRIDFIICDWNMPVMSGVDLLRAVRSDPKLESIPFLMVTAETGGDIVAEAVEEDVDGYIVKPFQGKTLNDRIEAILENRRNPDAMSKAIRRVRTHMNAGEPLEAVKVLEAALKEKPESPRLLLALGEALEALDQEQKAIDSYNLATKKAKRFVKARDRLAGLYIKQGRIEEAAEQLRQAAKISPRNGDRQLKLGRALMAVGDVKAGAAALRAAQDYSSGDAAVAKEAGDLLLKAGLTDQAAEALHTAAELDPRMAHVYNQLGMAYRRAGDHEKALAEYARALAVAPEDENLRYNFAVAQAEAGYRREAMESLREALKLRPDFKEAEELLRRLRP